MDCTARATASLEDKLAGELPKDYKFTIYHIATPLARCPAIYSSPPGIKPESTSCENHFLAVAIDPPTEQEAGRQLVLAIEIIIYTTANLTTLFVSKADSTGYMHLLGLSKERSSPLKAIASTFISFLAESKQRPGNKLVVSLFARAQDQYLFPGSVENDGKHVLDDRGLIRWWCRVLDPVLRSHPPPTDDAHASTSSTSIVSEAFALVPGLDKYEAAGMFPPSSRLDPTSQKRWQNADPLRQLSAHPHAPPRCLIPHFPDDPKARFLDELDDELANGDNATNASSSSSQIKSRTSSGKGKWKSVHSLDQFWELMQFRQECASGRLVGFIWVVFTPMTLKADRSRSTLPTPAASQEQAENSRLATLTLSKKSRNSRRNRHLTGPIVPRAPRVKNADKTSLKLSSDISSLSNSPLILSPKGYERIHALLLRLDFSTAVLAAASTRRWIKETAVIAQVGTWAGNDVVGRKENIIRPSAPTNGDGKPDEVAVLNTGLVRKRKKAVLPEDAATEIDRPAEAESISSNGVNVLGVGFVKKKPKV
ncbi:MAG: hypothetical protein M1825_005934 [Sarcosagium campestre]|nr:MAG: hypothetical protein M1825_005934 [Sarcosagium campestre]